MPGDSDRQQSDSAACEPLPETVATVDERVNVGAPTGEAEQLSNSTHEPQSSLTTDEELSAGCEIDRYVVLERLGAGGMGVVYKAFDPVLDRTIAIKVVRFSKSDNSLGRDRLLREAQALAQLAHPNVISVYDSGAYDDQVFIAMELVEGLTLRQWIASNRPSSSSIVSVLTAAGDGIAAAHKRGLVHRDIKPDNIIIGDDGRVRVLDFGLARADETTDRREIELETTGSHRSLNPTGSSGALLGTPLTQAGSIVGTPVYMAPEQFLGATLDARTDQFSFCIVLYEALYGKRPFRGKRLSQLRSAVVKGQLLDPPRDKVAKHIRTAILRGLSSNPDDRFPSMLELIRVLRHNPWQRRRSAAVATVIVFLIGFSAHAHFAGKSQGSAFCSGGQSYANETWNEPTRQKLNSALMNSNVSYGKATFDRIDKNITMWRDAWAAAHRDICEATHVRKEQSELLMDRKLSCLSRKRAQLGRLITILSAEPGRETIDRAVLAVARTTDLRDCRHATAIGVEVPPNQRSEVAQLEAQLDEAHVLERAGRYQLGLRLARAASGASQSLAHIPLQARAKFVEGTLLRSNGEFHEAARVLDAAARLAGEAQDTVLAARSLIARFGVVGIQLAKRDQIENLSRSARVVVALAGSPSRLQADLSGALGEAHLKGGEMHEALMVWQDGLRNTEEGYGRNTVEFAVALNRVGVALRATGDQVAAEEHFLRALRTFEEVVGSRHPLTAKPLVNLGGLATDRGQYKRAEMFARRVLDIREEALPPTHPRLANAYRDLGMALFYQDRFDEAAELFRRSIALLETSLGKEHPHVAWSLNFLGGALAKQGDVLAARQSYERALAIRTKVYGAKHSTTAHVLTNIASLECSSGRLASAESRFRSALEVFARGAEESPTPWIRLRSTYASCLLEHNAPRRARTILAPVFAASRAKLLNGIAPIERSAALFTMAQALVRAGLDKNAAVAFAERARADVLESEDREGLPAIEAWLKRHRN